MSLPSTLDRTSQETPRERQALEQLGVTTFSRGVRQVLAGTFIAVIVAIPLFETVQEVRENLAAREQLRRQGVSVADMPGRRPRVADVLTYLPVPRPEELRALENDLLLNSTAGRFLRPWVQAVLSRTLGVGNPSVVVGRHGWLHYVDGVEYVTGRGFLEADHLARAQELGRFSDPRPAILQLHRELEAMDVALVVLPIPDKAVIVPGSLARGLEGTFGLQNRSWNTFASELRRAGVRLLDLTAAMSQAEAGGSEQFLRTDTHWSAAGIDTAAEATVEFISGTLGVEPGPPRYQRREIRTDKVTGDLIGLLGLPDTQAKQLPNETVVLHPVIDASGERWQPDPNSDILLIGDSFSEFRAADNAGLAEQISYFLQQPLDRRASFTPRRFDGREALGTSLAEVRRSARRYRVIIWEFAIRKLSVGDWPLLP